MTVIDHVGSSFKHLDPEYRGRTIEAEPLAEHVLTRAGIEHADAVAAVTNSDTTNAVVARMAHSVFHVPTVVSRNYDPRWLPLHEAMGLDVVSTALWGSQRMGGGSQTRTGPVLARAGAPAVGKAIQEIPIPRASTICAILRRGEVVIPRGNVRFEIDDEVLALAGVGSLPELAALFGAPPAGRT